MKIKFALCQLMMAALLSSSLSYGQNNNWQNNKNEATKIVQKLNTPMKTWKNGCWKTQNDGSRVWEKGYWRFEEKTFQEKSKLLRKKMAQKNKA